MDENDKKVKLTEKDRKLLLYSLKLGHNAIENLKSCMDYYDGNARDDFFMMTERLSQMTGVDFSDCY